MLTRLPLDLPTALPEVLPQSGDRIATLEQRLQRQEREHKRLMEALAAWYEALNKGNVLEVADAVITASQGIKFPATQVASTDANTLDDYEEGTTTPTPTSGGGTFTTVSASVNYTKVGRLVSYDCTVTITTNGTANTYVLVPMPFTAAELTGQSGTNQTDILGLCGYVSGSNLLIKKYDGTYPGADGKVLEMSGSYRV